MRTKTNDLHQASRAQRCPEGSLAVRYGFEDICSLAKSDTLKESSTYSALRHFSIRCVPLGIKAPCITGNH